MRKPFVTFFLAISLTAATMGQRANDHAVGHWEGEVMRNGKIWRISANISEAGNDLKAAIDFPDLDVIDVPFPVALIKGRLHLERPQPNGNPIVFDGIVKGDELSRDWKGFGVDGSFVMKRVPARPKLYREVEVTFANRDVHLSGTVLMPAADGKHPLRFPAVVIVHGSMPNERTAYRSWARHFAENGIAALIYDKRGSGRSTGDTRAASMEDLANDALAGIRMLKLRRDIDAGKVGIAGHSQGGWIAPLAASRSGDVAFVIVSGAAAVTPAEQSIYHRAGVMRKAGMTEAEIAEASRLRQLLYLLNHKILARDRDVAELRASISRELADRKSERWFALAELPPELSGDLPPHGALELLFFDVAPSWQKVKVPVLAIWGDRDTVVPVEQSRSRIVEYLEKTGNKDFTTEVLKGVDHANNMVSDDAADWDFPRANLDYDRTIIRWLKSRVGQN